MDKIGTRTSRADQAPGAGKGLQYVQSGVAYGDSASAVMVTSEDVGVVRWGEALLPFPTPVTSELRLGPSGASFVLFDNAWNTNFCLWWPFEGGAEVSADKLRADAVFHFGVSQAACSGQ